MGLSVTGALIAIALSWLGQSPQLMRRLGLASARLDRRVRAFTGYALALLLLAIAFFLAGVPLGTASDSQGLAQQEQTSATATDVPGNADGSDSVSVDDIITTPATPETGAFSGPPVSGTSSNETALPTTVVTPRESPLSPDIERTTSTAPNLESSVEPSPSATLRPTETATPLPTATPFPTLTPTTIAGETAVVSTLGSTLWLKRSPGGQNLVLVRSGDVVLLLSGHANQGGTLWREVATGDGIQGWLQSEFLVTGDRESLE